MDTQKFERTLKRFVEKTKELEAARSHIIFLADTPSSYETKAQAPKCKAVTLEGRACKFAATRGAFCTKHACSK